MRLAVTVVSPSTRQSADLVLDADPTTPVADIAAEFGRVAYGGFAAADQNVLRFPGPRSTGSLAMAQPQQQPAAPQIPLFVDYQPVDPSLTIEQSDIRDGSVVSLGGPEGCVRPEPTGLVEIRVTGGPAAGAVHRLSIGQADIGGGRSTAIRIADGSVPDYALQVAVDPRGGTMVVPFESVQATIDREPLENAVQWLPGQQITVGATLLTLAPYEPPDAALHPSDDGSGIDFNRPPRLLPPERQTKFNLPSPPTKEERRPLPILMAAAPVVLGVAMAYFMHEIYMLAMCAMSPVMLLGNYFSDRKRGTKSWAVRTTEYNEHKARIEADAAAALDLERVQRRDEAPDPATVLSIASGPRRRLWERRSTDPDYLMLRVGTADLPSAVELTDPTQDDHRRQVFWEIPDAPVTVPLAERGVLGVAGPGDSPRAIGRWVVAQAATLHSPNDLQVYVLTDSSGESCWQWTRWLPHSRPTMGQNCVSLIGNDVESVATRIAELISLINARQKALREAGGREVRFGQDVLVVFDGSRKLRSLPGAIQVLKEGPSVGVFSVCLDADERLLPAECQAVTIVEPDGGLRVQQMMAQTIRGVRPDYVRAGWCSRISRGMASVRDVSDSEDGVGLPDSARLLEVLQLEPPTANAIAARWRSGGRSTVAMIGESYDGPFGIDMRKDGPHGLIAGTTGAGKSELLQSLVASLAVANRPDEMTFVLVDYKGGSAFKDCVELPHTVGMVTDLDTHLVERALVSLSAELTRREHLLAGVGAKDIEDYQLLLDRSPGRLEPMPRLLIVIDEFASMVRELPDFVTGLVNIAQRGRSLGIHLILATQRPSGVVSGDIRANTNLRIALRVTDQQESADVIDAKDAAHISKSTPGRAYVRLGHASLVPFQTGRVGGRRPGAVQQVTERPWLAQIDWNDLGRPEPTRPVAKQRESEEITDLKVLVTEIGKAVAGLGIPPQHSPWLPALPENLLLNQLRPGAYGVEDLPAWQRQQPVVMDLESFSHLMAAGAPRTGRSQLLRTIAGTLALAHTSADVHMYGIDCGNGALLPLADLPHCGAVVQRTQPERAARLLRRLAGEIGRRQELLAMGGFADINEQRSVASPQERLAHVFVFLDRWEGFTTTLGESQENTDIITKILGEGAGAGVHLVMTGDRSLVAGRMAAMCEEKLAFKLAEKDDFGMIGLRAKDLPDDIPAGRCFRASTGIEVQVALLDADPSGQGQAAALRAIAASCASRDAAVPTSLRPFRVDMLPSRISFDDGLALRPAGAGPLWAMAGVGGDELSALGPDLAEGIPVFLIAGPPRCGKSTMLVSMARSLLAASTPVVLLAPGPSPLRSLAGEPGVIRMFDSSAVDEDEFVSALAEAGRPCVVLADDAENLKDCDAAGVILQIFSGGRDGHALVAAGDAEALSNTFGGGWLIQARRGRRGCLFAPQTIPEGDIIGVRLSNKITGEAVRPGQAFLHLGDGTLRTIVVPSD